MDVSADTIVRAILVYIFLIAALKAAIEFLVTRPAAFEQLDPLERNLQRVSHSIAYMIAALVLYNGYRPALAAIYIRIFGYSAYAEQWSDGALAAVVAVSIIRIRTGHRAFRFFNPEFYEHTSILRAKAAVKSAIGLGGLFYLHFKRKQYIYAGESWELAYNALWLIAAWCVVIGPIRLFLLRPRRSLDAGDIIEDDIDHHRFDWGE
jgi:hypothetical protein